MDGKESACNAGDLGLTLNQEDPLEKGMATPSSILAWRIPWTEEPGSYSLWDHKESDKTERLTPTHTHTYTHLYTVECNNIPSSNYDNKYLQI